MHQCEIVTTAVPLHASQRPLDNSERNLIKLSSRKGTLSMSAQKKLRRLIAVTGVLASFAAFGTAALAQEHACCRHYVEGHSDGDDFWSWNTLEDSAIHMWRRHAADQCGGYWNQWKWEDAANKKIGHSDPPGPKTRRATAMGNPCK